MTTMAPPLLKFTLVCQQTIMRGRLAGKPCNKRLPVAVSEDREKAGIAVYCDRCEQVTVLE